MAYYLGRDVKVMLTTESTIRGVKLDGSNELEMTADLSTANFANANIRGTLATAVFQKDTISARSDLAPSATLSFDSTKTDDLSSTIDEREKETLTATVSWPFYSGGKNYANLNKNKSLELQKNLVLWMNQFHWHPIWFGIPCREKLVLESISKGNFLKPKNVFMK